MKSPVGKLKFELKDEGLSSNVLVGVILAGGRGTRLLPLTRITNKHLLPVFDKPMIYYPIMTLKDIGCSEIIIVSGGDHIGDFCELLGDGRDLDVRITYRIQTEAGGIAQALLCAEGLVSGTFPVILGDNYFNPAPKMAKTPQIYLNKVIDPQRFGVYQDGKIIEKPKKVVSDLAVTGFYVVDDTVFDFIKGLNPSARGELEITDVNNWYLDKGFTPEVYKGYWRDMGTFPSLFEVSERVKNSQRQE